MASQMWETTTTAGTLMVQVQFGATLQTLKKNGTTVLSRPVSSWKMLDVRRRIFG